MSKKKRDSECFISRSLDVFGDKWSLLIIRDLMMKKQCLYSDFSKSPEKIATNILASRLQDLEEEGIILKTKLDQNKAKFAYSLTEKGINLLPILVEMYLWAEQYNPISEDSPFVLKNINNENKNDFIREIISFLKE